MQFNVPSGNIRDTLSPFVLPLTPFTTTPASSSTRAKPLSTIFLGSEAFILV